ncbi:hypothetical protein ACFOEY_15425 [Paracandidimonas soli]
MTPVLLSCFSGRSREMFVSHSRLKSGASSPQYGGAFGALKTLPRSTSS